MKLLPLTLAIMLVIAGMPATTIADDNGRPLADAGLDQSTTVGSTVYLDGGGSLDPDGELVGYNWSIETPSGDTVRPADPDAVRTRFVPDETGRYHVTLTVTGDDDQEQSDTLYVDVERTEEPPSTETASPATETPQSSADAETATPAADSGTSTTAGDPSVIDANQPPTGDIVGPSTVTSGSRVTYTIDASDPDGEVSELWWLPTSLSQSRARQSELRSSTRSFTAGGTPGTTADLSAIVVDDDGATSTVTKTVEVINTPPTASISGDSTAVVNTTKEYRLTATDPDGEITAVSLTSGADAVEPTGAMPWDGPTSSGAWARSFRFTEIPEDDGTVTFEATVRDEHGGVTTVEKEVTVVNSTKTQETANPVAQYTPEILNLEASFIDTPEGINSRQILFSAEATDPDSDRLTFDWRIGDAAMLRNRAGGEPAQASISYALEDLQFEDGTVDVTLTVSDQNGNQRAITETFEVHRPDSAEGNVGRAYQIHISKTQGRTVYGSYRMNKIHAGETILISFGDKHSQIHTLGNSNSYQFKHKYDSSGRYAISVSPGWSSDSTTAPVEVSERTYTVWFYEQNETEVLRTEATESPGENWIRDGIAYIDREQVGIETTKTLANDDRALMRPGQEWTRAGITTEYHTEQRTTESTSHPDGGWTLTERNVDQKQLFTGWQHTTVPQRGLLGGDWEYVEAVPYTVEDTETKRAVDHPGGNGWSRGEQVGQTQVDYRTQWVDYQFHADQDWQYLGSDRYISGYDTTTWCVEYIQLYQTRHCVEEETDYDLEYDYRYEYRVSVYESVYEWERTVEETEYKYRYRAATYTIEAVHEYVKEVRVGTEYVQWERPVFEETDIYQWKNTQQMWAESSSFSKPPGDVRNLTKVVRECGTEPASQEPDFCEGEA